MIGASENGTSSISSAAPGCPGTSSWICISSNGTGTISSIVLGPSNRCSLTST
uniref:Uncharacterized protein n=1 Tax=Zea mays TaxID=4577 RepID=C0PLK0_MAIZE|nr:unknown [Zea mays]